MSAKINIPENHPRYRSMMIREKIIQGCADKVVAPAGLIAQGRGEAFDYLLGEKTPDFAADAIRAASAAFLLAQYPVISVNGNAAQLAPEDLVKLSQVSGAPLEINLFYREPGREEAIFKVLKKAGAGKVLGLSGTAGFKGGPEDAAPGHPAPGHPSPGRAAVIEELSSDRRIVDPEGIMKADMVFVPLEDGDRTEALVKLGKRVVTVDLNPLSRTPNKAHVSIIDNLTRVLPLLCENISAMKNWDRGRLENFYSEYNNKAVLKKSLLFMSDRLKNLAGDI